MTDSRTTARRAGSLAAILLALAGVSLGAQAPAGGSAVVRADAGP